MNDIQALQVACAALLTNKAHAPEVSAEARERIIALIDLAASYENHPYVLLNDLISTLSHHPCVIYAEATPLSDNTTSVSCHFVGKLA